MCQYSTRVGRRVTAALRRLSGLPGRGAWVLGLWLGFFLGEGARCPFSMKYLYYLHILYHFSVLFPLPSPAVSPLLLPKVSCKSSGSSAEKLFLKELQCAWEREGAKISSVRLVQIVIKPRKENSFLFRAFQGRYKYHYKGILLLVGGGVFLGGSF